MRNGYILNDYIIDPLFNSEERDAVNDKTSAEKVIHTIEKTIPLAQNLYPSWLNLEYKYVNLKHSLGKINY